LSINGDLEDMSVGPCPSNNEQCLFLAYIGNNKVFLLGQAYNRLKVAIIQLKNLKLLETVYLRYQRPLGSGYHVEDSEAFSVHPQSGNWYLVTKFPPNKIYKLTREQVQKSAGKIQTMSYLGELRLSSLDGITNAEGKAKENYQKVTSMDISPNGKKFILATYGMGIEYYANLDQLQTLQLGTSKILDLKNQTMKLEVLPQTEAITYTNCGLGFAYASEKNKKREGNKLTPFVHTMNCH
jgi:hypothetical protein